MARALYARALLAANKKAEARKQIEAAAPLLGRAQDRLLHFQFAVVDARVQAASGDPAEGIRRLNGLLEEMTKKNIVSFQFESRLALGEIEMNSGDTTTGRARPAALENEARAKGFLLIASKAAAAAR